MVPRRRIFYKIRIAFLSLFFKIIYDFYIFESCVKKINSSAEEIFFSKYYENENLFENFLYVRQNKILINNMIDFLNIKRPGQTYLICPLI